MQAKALGSKFQKRSDQFTYRWVIGKATGDGETTSVEIVCNEEDLGQHVGLVYNLLDTRMFQQNERRNNFMFESAKLPVEVMRAVRQCNEVAFGRANTEDLVPMEPPEEETPSA